MTVVGEVVGNASNSFADVRQIWVASWRPRGSSNDHSRRCLMSAALSVSRRAYCSTSLRGRRPTAVDDDTARCARCGRECIGHFASLRTPPIPTEYHCLNVKKTCLPYSTITLRWYGGAVIRRRSRTCDRNNLGQVIHTYLLL